MIMEKVIIDEKAKEFLAARRAGAITIKLEKYGGG